ncbi:MAG: hypothetical protein IID08_03650 [Candidatus Hydrogenedentes bacterium]|nr:hypothetical protein [Candidatus Hydrogenedentota bacterium]
MSIKKPVKAYWPVWCIVLCLGALGLFMPHSHVGHGPEHLAKPCTACQIQNNLAALESSERLSSDPFEPTVSRMALGDDEMYSRDRATLAPARALPAA